MTELSGDAYKDEHDQQGTAPGEGRNDAPATTGTHRGWGDPQAVTDTDEEAEEEEG
jgi:hypothetical protein